MTDAELIAAAIAAVEVELSRALTPAETAQAEQRAGNALFLIRIRLGDDLTELNQKAIVIVLTEVLLGRIEATATSGLIEDSETIDDYTYRRKFSQATSRVNLLPEWWELLSPGRESGAFSTRPGFEPDRPPLDTWA